MDLDAYSAAHRAEWDRLARLSADGRLDGGGADDLIDSYQAGATQLSVISTTIGSSIQGDRLSLALSRARLRFTGTGVNPLRQLTVFFTTQLPAALYRIRWLSIAIAAVTVIIGLVYGLWVSGNPQVPAALGPRDYLQNFAEQDFVSYYSDNSEAGFTGQVWTNNAWIAAQCVMLGITGVWPAYMIFTTAQQLGLSAAIMNEFGHLDHFFLYILPHGQLELYSIFMAAAAGLLIFWAWIAPGARTRAAALAEDGRAFFTIVIGLVLTLLMSGLIEGFVTRQDWPWPIKIGIGTVALAIVLTYQWVVGRRAARAGETGDLGEFDAGARQIVSA